MTQKIKKTGWFKLRRGVVDHMAEMSSAELKLFIACATQADYYEESPDGEGKRSRYCPMNNKQLAEICGWTVRHLMRIKYELIDKGYLKIQEGELVVMKFGDEAEAKEENIPKMSPPSKPEYTKNVTPHLQRMYQKCHPPQNDQSIPKMSPPSDKELKDLESKSKTESKSKSRAKTKTKSQPKSKESRSKKLRSKTMELNTRGESLRGGQGGATVSQRSVSMNQEKKEILTQIKTYHRAFEKKILAKLGGIMGQWKNWGLSNTSESRTHRGQNPVAAYLDLFRTEGMVEKLGKLSPTKELRLLGSLSEIALGKAKFNGQPMTCSIADFLEAVQEVNKRGLRRPITNHNYLKQVVLTHNYSTKKRAPRIMRYGKKTSTTRRKGWYQE